MMQVTKKLKQRTFDFEGKKFQIKSRPRTWYGNHIGFFIWVNGVRYHVNCLEREEAETKALIRYKKEFPHV